jgi:hypothetical protein
LNNAVELSNNRDGELSMRIYTVDNGSGSAGYATCEVSHNLLIAVSEYDEQPKQNLFEIGPFYNPKIVRLNSFVTYKIIFVEYGEFESRESIQMKVSIDDLKMEN